MLLYYINYKHTKNIKCVYDIDVIKCVQHSHTYETHIKIYKSN